MAMTVALPILNALGSCAALFLAGTYVHQAWKAKRRRKAAQEAMRGFGDFIGRVQRAATECDCERCTAACTEQKARVN